MIRRVLATVVSLAALMAVPSAAPTVSRPLLVSTDKGVVAGAAADGVARYLGIPYAAPPVGGLRWQPPAPAAPWPGVRPADHHGARCVQTATGGPGTSEDCLYLNVHAPEQRTDRPLPVLFWIHGGGFMSGGGDLYDGSLLARTNDIVVVTINYRLGVFGFLDLPGLSERGAGNYGLLDQQAALRWTQRNIAAFGGDPGRVTIAGESAGGQSVCALLASPPARGLFDRAIIQSGGCPSLTAAQATARGKRYADAAGCRDSVADVSCLRAKRTDELLAAGGDFGGILNGPLPVSGVPELPVTPGLAVRSGRFTNVPILIGTNRDETRKWALPFAHATQEQFTRVIRRQFGPHADEVLARYSYGAHDSPYGTAYALGAVWTDSSVFHGMGGCHYQRLAGQFASHQPRTFFYEFGDRNPPPSPGPTPPGFTPGATHATELPYLWPGMTPKPLTPEQRRLSGAMVRYWGAFTKGAHPATRKQAAWPPYRSAKFMSLLPGDHSKAVTSEAYSARHQCSYWNRISYDRLTTEPADLARSTRSHGK
ncbi:MULTISPECIES: carboxylesterase/lipase family protein [Streptomyces violaceusniger group]|uniref:Carboxylic ester hydrolase n=1 Tax=Streptomyces rhizosphaericus TaxID=114699 RepID=A0ABP4CWE0_9ACTN|nr:MULTISPECIES: carboxylesterase family protein [Streptomyces violaceusniger group]